MPTVKRTLDKSQLHPTITQPAAHRAVRNEHNVAPPVGRIVEKFQEVLRPIHGRRPQRVSDGRRKALFLEEREVGRPFLFQ
jgi:hypothetical protein